MYVLAPALPPSPFPFSVCDKSRANGTSMTKSATTKEMAKTDTQNIREE